MNCPFCGYREDKVIDSRESREGDVIRRRRECLQCGRRFTTYERIDEVPYMVVKKDGSRVPFSRDKIRTGLEKACWKRPISSEQIDAVVSAVEREIQSRCESEVDSRELGELVMEKRRVLDQVAYVRFASVYRNFTAAEDFVREVGPMLQRSAAADNAH